MRSVRTLILFLLAASLPAIASADVTWTTGAPGGTSGGAVNFEGLPGDALLTGVLAADFGGDRAGGSLGSDYTASMWINSDSAADNEWWLGNNGRGVHFGIQNGSTLEVGHWSADSSGTTVVPAGTWVHATFTYDADGGVAADGTTTGLQSIYYNGVLEGTAVNDAPLESGGEIQLGARRGGIGPGFNGSLDDVALWDSVLSAADIADLFDGTQTALDLGAGAYYDFEDDQLGTTAAFQGSGINGNGGALVGITPIPEPSSLAILLGLGALGFVRRKRS